MLLPPVSTRKVLVAGGHDGSGSVLKSAELYAASVIRLISLSQASCVPSSSMATRNRFARTAGQP